ncbi:TPA: DNA double-strand break repair nuclease NurA [Candidatus Woesearchaeota archaeon]|nr:DNA double-strand break repair nuclease NurA [Candidatus Woesearchaeota archaeon]
MVNQQDFDTESGHLNRFFIHPHFRETIQEINNFNIKLPPNPNPQELDFEGYTFPPDAKLEAIEEIKNYNLDAKAGEKLSNKISVAAYDESINKFDALPGTAYATSHSLVLQHETEYIPTVFVSFYFYTRSNIYKENSKYIKLSNKPEEDSKRDYIKDRHNFILNNTPLNIIVLIDGPLIGGQVTQLTNQLNDALLRKNVIPIFFVKNSNSNLVTDNIIELRGKYNSDLHWAFETLKEGERSAFFKYYDEYSPKKAKVFCYIKPFNVSPQRIEFHIDTFNILRKKKDELNNILNFIYYLLLAQGNPKDPQVRTIKIAEMFAREALRLYNVEKIMKEAKIIPTINQERFGW